MRSAIHRSSSDWNSSITSRNTHRPLSRRRHTPSPWRLSNSSLTYSADSLRKLEKSAAASRSPGRLARSRCSTINREANSRL